MQSVNSPFVAKLFPRRILSRSCTLACMAFALSGCLSEPAQREPADMPAAASDAAGTGAPPEDLSSPDLALPDLSQQPDLQSPPDTFYVGDEADDTVKQYDAATGSYRGLLFTSGSGGLHGPRGLLIAKGGTELWVANQNTDLPKNGSILRFNLMTGSFLGALVADSAAGSPFCPRGMVIAPSGELVVADNGELTSSPPGRMPTYSGGNGAFLSDLDKTGFLPPFLPRGSVVGPDGLLYVSVIDSVGEKGYVVRFDLATRKYKDTFITATSATGYAGGLHKPEGLVFGPDGNLYVTSFKYLSGDTSRIMIYDPTGANIGRINLDGSGPVQNAAQAILFGPSGRLFVGMSIAGEIRSYDVVTKTYVSFVNGAGPLRQPWYMTFGKTNPATLAYAR